MKPKVKAADGEAKRSVWKPKLRPDGTVEISVHYQHDNGRFTFDCVSPAKFLQMSRARVLKHQVDGTPKPAHYPTESEVEAFLSGRLKAVKEPQLRQEGSRMPILRAVVLATIPMHIPGSALFDEPDEAIGGGKDLDAEAESEESEAFEKESQKLDGKPEVQKLAPSTDSLDVSHLVMLEESAIVEETQVLLADPVRQDPITDDSHRADQRASSSEHANVQVDEALMEVKSSMEKPSDEAVTPNDTATTEVIAVDENLVEQASEKVSLLDEWQLRVLSLCAEGLSNKEILKKIGRKVGYSQVAGAMTAIYKKLGIEVWRVQGTPERREIAGLAYKRWLETPRESELPVKEEVVDEALAPSGEDASRIGDVRRCAEELKDNLQRLRASLGRLEASGVDLSSGSTELEAIRSDLNGMCERLFHIHGLFVRKDSG